MNLNLKIKKKNEWIQPWSQHEYDTECNGNLLKVCQTNSKNHAMIWGKLQRTLSHDNNGVAFKPR